MTSEHVFINSFPKGGTHLVSKLLSALGYTHAPVPITSGMLTRRNLNPAKKLFRRLTRAGGYSTDTVLIGVDLPVAARRAWLARYLASVPGDEYVTGHVRYSESVAEILSSLGYRCILVIRDPRDVAVSHAYYAATEPGHVLQPYYSALKSLDERIALSIRGGYVEKVGYLESIGVRARSLDGWRCAPGFLTVRFEDLVGEKGGGTRAQQEQTIRRICEHVGVAVPADLSQLADELFGGTKTFRKGAIGGWKQEFSAENLKLFNQAAGDVLEAWGYSKE